MKSNCKLKMSKLIFTFFIFFLGFSNHVIIISVAAVPSTRTLNLDAKSSISQAYLLLHQEIKNNMDVVVRERYNSRRMDIETNDYPDPGANRDHDPPVSGGGTP